MNIIINTSTLSASGATQVATSFIQECKEFPENKYHVFLSNTVQSQINVKDFPQNFFFYSFPISPLYGLKGISVRKELEKLEQKIKPDIVFSIFGPSWWTPKVSHLQGYAYPHYVYPESPLFRKLSFFKRLKISIIKKIHLYFLNKNGSFFVSETVDVSNRIKKLLPPKNIFYSVGNTCSSYFSQYKFNDNVEKTTRILPLKQNGEFRFLTLCTYHLHKNLEILNEVIPILNQKNPKNNFRFVLTIDDENFQRIFSDEAKKSIINIGRVDVKNCPQLYEECDALFLPTLLECFSANYPEAMIMEKPILTSNLSFATSVCEEAALYFDPISAKDIVEKINKLYEDENVYKNLVENGKLQLKKFPTAQERAIQYLSICNKIIKENA